MAYNLGNFLRRLALPRSVKHWSLTTLREKLIKIGAKVVRHSKYLTFQMPRCRCRGRCSQQSSSGFSGLVCHRRWFDPHDGYDNAKGVLIPVRRRSLLRGERGKRSLRLSREPGWAEPGVQRQVSPPECPSSLAAGLARQ